MAQQADKKPGVLRSLDWVTIVIYLLLLAGGWMSVCGASYDYGDTDLLSLSTRSGMQIVWIASSIVIGLVLLLLDDRYYDMFAYIIYIILLILLFATIFNPHTIKGSRSWLVLGPLRLQPAEFAKFAVALALGKLMAYTCFGGTLLAMLFSIYAIPFNVCYVMLGLCILMICYLIVLALYNRLIRYAMITLFAIMSTSFFYITDTLFEHLDDHQRIRIEVLLGMKDDPRGAGYNVNQAKIAIGSGGLFGKGFLNGTQTKLRYVPEQHTDFIFCTVGEEEGFIGSAGVLIVYLLFIWRLIALAERQTDTMGRVYGYCVLCIFLFHLFINVGMVLGLTPVIGIPLPFFSYGGSSLWGFTLLLFIFLRMDAERNLKRQ